MGWTFQKLVVLPEPQFSITYWLFPSKAATPDPGRSDATELLLAMVA